MHISTSLIAALATAFVGKIVSAQASTGVPNLSIDFSSLVPTSTLPASVKSSYLGQNTKEDRANHKLTVLIPKLSEIAAKASSQVTNSAFKAEISKISEASGRDLVSDITKAAAEALWSVQPLTLTLQTIGTHTSPLPSWLNALSTTGYALSALNGDIDAVFQSEIGDKTLASSVKSEVTAKASSLKSDASSLSSSLASKASSVESKVSSSVSSATSISTGGAAPAHVTGVMALGAVMAGGVGIMVGAAGY
ncbi:MAG: hypothetical protein Q9195_007561 [Heterodermia aff. obscurata]